MSGSTVPGRIWSSDDGEATAFTRLPYNSAAPAARHMSSSPTSTRPTSPSIFTRRLHSAKNSEPKGPDSMFPNRNHRLSLQYKPNDKGKTPLRGDSLGNGDLNSMTDHPFSTYDRVRPPSVSSVSPSNGFNSRRNRNSFIGAASDALSFKFGRKARPILRQAPLPIILPDVIEISAPPPDQEVEERNRLREMAAQAIGISPFIVHPDSYSQEESTEDEEDEVALRTPVDTSELRRFGDARNSESAPDILRNKSFLETSSVHTANPLRYRSGSVVSHSRHNSIVFTPVPPFPTNVLSLNPFLACSAYFPKYTQPSSLRRFALASKNWKTRYIILSTPATSLSRNPTPAVSYLHLFKSSGPDDKEVERLEIHTDSAVFVADEEIGGRRNVIRIKGFEVIPGRANSNGVHEATWQLHIIDPVESHKWISTIKSAILGQRTIAAGLGIPPTPTGSEPRGDLDVIMKMRAQGLATSAMSPIGVVSMYEGHPPKSPTDPNYASSISSQSVHSQATVPKPAPSGTVSALKGLFTSRPRSGSRATTVDSERQQVEHDHNEESFASMGTNLLGMLRSNTPDIQSNLTPLNNPVQPRNTLPFTPYPTATNQRTERKVLAERQPEQRVNHPTSVASDKNRANRALSLGAFSLQPPPRRRWASLRPTSANTNDEPGFRLINPDPAVTNIFGSRLSTERPETEPPSSPVDFSSFSMSQHDVRPRAPSLQSVSTYGSENTKKSNSSAKRTSKRWSRQLPQQLTPPSGPPPAIPATASTTQLHLHPVGLERPLSTSSTISAQSRQSVLSDLPTFSKRASTSSSRSVNSTTQNSSVSSSSSSRGHRASMPPPPRPAPTSALPLAPDQDAPPASGSSGAKSSFRNSVAQRALRLSLIAPKPPPSTNLPPRPDEVEFNANKKRHHRHSSSSARSQTLDTIPEPSKHPASPFPPPVGPLPPTPAVGDDIPPPVSQHSSLRERLRNLSAPSPLNGGMPLQIPPPRSMPTSSTTPTPTPFLMQFTHSNPPTPNAEKMMIFSQEQQSFLLMNTTPTLANLSPTRYLFEEKPMIEMLDDVTPLAPPPSSRRGSKQLIVVPEPSQTAASTPVEVVSISTAMDMMISRSNSGSTTGYDDDEDEDPYHHRPRHYENENENDHDEYDDDDLSAVADSVSVQDEQTKVQSARHSLTPMTSMKEMTATTMTMTSATPDPLRVFSLSPPGSVVSLGVSV